MAKARSSCRSRSVSSHAFVGNPCPTIQIRRIHTRNHPFRGSAPGCSLHLRKSARDTPHTGHEKFFAKQKKIHITLIKYTNTALSTSHKKQNTYQHANITECHIWHPACKFLLAYYTFMGRFHFFVDFNCLNSF